MIRLSQAVRGARAHVITVIVGLAVFALVSATLPSSGLQAQATGPKNDRTNVANDPEVLGAERLFSAWIEGQIAYRGIPGVAVGVVSDQELVWAKGFGFADIKAKLPMTPATKFRMASPRGSNASTFAAVST